MLDKELGEALLKLDLAADSGAADTEVQRIIDHDRQRLKWLMRATIGLLIVAGLGAMLVFFIGGLVFPRINNFREAQAKHAAPTDEAFLMLAKLTAMTIVLNLASFGALVAAGLATIALIFRSRRVTLRQINANLRQISEQMKRFQTPDRGSN